MEKISDDVTKGASKSAARAMLRAVGLQDDDFNKFQVGVVSAGNEVTPCNLTGPELSEFAKKGVNGPDSAALIFSTIAVSDGISMGHEGMRASLVSREVIADSPIKLSDKIKRRAPNNNHPFSVLFSCRYTSSADAPNDEITIP